MHFLNMEIVTCWLKPKLSGGAAVRLDEWLGGRSVSHESKVHIRADRKDANCELHPTQQLVSVGVYSDLSVVQALVITLI
jgi:hypothetical protein